MPDTTHGLAIVGPGLVGTSIALAARRRWPDVEIVTVDKGEPLSKIASSPVVVLSSPVHAILAALPELAGSLLPNALVMDTGSTKREIMAAAAAARIPHFVGTHPMAGGTTLAEARADLFDNRPWFLANPDAPDAVLRASTFVEALGAKPIVLPDHGEEHDRLMAAVSHLPQVTATMLMAIVARAVAPEDLQWAGNGLRDTTRLAASHAAVWQSVLASNTRELRPLLKQFASELAAFADRLDDPDAVTRLFEEANRARAACK
jgi:prephenate dehydrogenase